MSKTVKLTTPTWRKLERLIKEEGASQAVPSSRRQDAAMVRVRNDSGFDCDQFGILGIEGVVFNPTDQPQSFRQSIVLTGTTPETAYHSNGRFVVCSEPLASGQLGNGWAAGVFPVQVNVTDATHACADILHNDRTKLVSAASGPCSILWQQTGTGTKWAVVRFGGSGGAVPQTRWFYVTHVPTDVPHRLTCRYAVYNVQYGVWDMDNAPTVTVWLTPQMHRSHFRAENIIVASLIPTTGVGGGQPRWVAHYNQPSSFREYGT
jgi:hypothetical protein